MHTLYNDLFIHELSLKYNFVKHYTYRSIQMHTNLIAKTENYVVLINLAGNQKRTVIHYKLLIHVYIFLQYLFHA